MFIIMMSDNFLSPRSYQQHRQPCNYTRFILKSVWSALYDICLYFLMETKVISIHRTAVKIHVYSKQINQYRAIADHQNLVLPVTILPPQHKMGKKKKKIVNILLNQSMNQYCHQANNVLEWKLMTFLRAPLINIHCIS